MLLNFQTSYWNLKIRGLGAKLSLFYHFNFERNYDDLKSKSPCILLNININFHKNETEPRQTLCFSSYENRKSKVKLWRVGARERKAFFAPFILSKTNFFDICVLSQCIVFLNTLLKSTCCYISKTLLHTLVFKIAKSRHWCMYVADWTYSRIF